MFAAAATLSLLALPLAAHAAVHEITVGGPGTLAYSPSSITAEIGDTLHFVFHQKNHTVTQSTFADPCTPMPGGFKSGFQPVPDSMTDGFPTCDWEVKTKDPLWVFCEQANHCSQGMVFAVNAPATGKTFDAFVTAAKGTSQSTPPPAGGDPYGSAPPAASGSAAAPAPSASAPATSTPPPATGGASIKVVVGGTGQLLFNPSRIDAKMGDTVTFEFHSKNHSVTQSSFNTPCEKLTAPIAGVQSVLDSGFQASNDTGPFPTFNVSITTTSPMWFYCAQANHCSQGMVFAINSVESSANTYAAFVAKAKGSTASSGSSSGSTSTNGAMSRSAVGAGAVFGLVGAVVALLL